MCKKLQESRVRWTPLFPIDEKKGFCPDLASCMHDDFVSQSLTEDEQIGLSCQIALRPTYISQKIDTHAMSDTSKNISKGNAVPVRVIQYNVQTLKDEGDEIDLYTRFKVGDCAIICLQGNRTNYNGIKDMHGYYRCIAAGVHGDHGAEVVISKHHHFAIDDDGKKCFVEREHVSIGSVIHDALLFVFAMLLLISIFVLLMFLFFNPPQILKKWWDSFTLTIKTHCRFGKTVV